MEHETDSPSLLEAVLDALDEERTDDLPALLGDLRAAELAHLLESLPPGARPPVWETLDAERRGLVLLELHDEVREGLIDAMSNSELVAALQDLDTEDLAYLFDDLPDAAAAILLGALTREDRNRLQQTLAYPEDSAGRLLDTDIITVRPSVTVDVVLRYLRRHEEIPPHTDALMVVDKHNTYLGVLPVARLLTARPGRTVEELMVTDADRVTADTPAREVAHLFERRDLVSVAVIDSERKLLGRITIDEVVDIIHESADQTLLNLAGLDQDDDLFAPVISSAQRRAVWLGINLGTAFLAAWVIGLFQATLEQVVALAVLMPVVASMGGIAGSQTLTIAIRGLALGQISSANARWLATKELAVGALNGLIWAVVVGVIAVAWFGNWTLGGVIAAAMVINLLAAACAGVVLPLALQKLKLDPALSGSVILTTVTDVVGFFSFLGLGTWLLL